MPNECDPYAPVPGFTEESLLTDADIAFMQENQDFMLGRQKRSECDHVVGVSCSVFCILGTLEFTNLSIVTNERFDYIDQKFQFCPNCGAKIDWEAIKEACDEDNE